MIDPILDPILDLKDAYFDRLLRRVALSENSLEFAAHFDRAIYRTLALRAYYKKEIASGSLPSGFLTEYKLIIEKLDHILGIGITL